jgi:hypothetical protein
VSEIDGEPALSLEDVRGMFLDMTLPTGWQSWKKRRVDWTVHATGLLLSAANEISRRKKQRFIVTGTIRNVAR